MPKALTRYRRIRDGQHPVSDHEPAQAPATSVESLNGEHQWVKQNAEVPVTQTTASRDLMCSSSALVAYAAIATRSTQSRNIRSRIRSAALNPDIPKLVVIVNPAPVFAKCREELGDDFNPTLSPMAIASVTADRMRENLIALVELQFRRGHPFQAGEHVGRLKGRMMR